MKFGKTLVALMAAVSLSVVAVLVNDSETHGTRDQ